MKVFMDGQAYEVPQAYADKMLGDLLAMMEDGYEKHLDDKTKFGIGALARGYLVKLEMDARAKYGKEAGRAVRPPPKTDATLWLVQLFVPMLREAIKNAAISCETEYGRVTAFNFSLPRQGEAGGLLGIDRDTGQREDHGINVS